MVSRLEIFEHDIQAFSAKSKRRQRVRTLINLILHLYVLLAILTFNTNRSNITKNYKGMIRMNDMITMSVRLPKEVVTWLRKSSAMATIEQDKRVSMNSLIVEILTKSMEADRRILTRFPGSGKKIEVENVEND